MASPHHSSQLNDVQNNNCPTVLSISSNCVQQPSKSSARAAREKALQEIRISLQPFANNDRPTSSASSTSDSSSSPEQTSGIGSSVSSNYSVIDPKETPTSRELLQLLLTNGYSEESAINFLKTYNDRNIESNSDSQPKEYKLEQIKLQSQLNDGSLQVRGPAFGVQPNAVPNPSLIGQIPIKSLRKSSVGENLLSREPTVNGSCGVSSRSDSPGVTCIANLHRDRLLPDQPRILNSNGLPLNEVHYHSSHGLPNGHTNGPSTQNGMNGQSHPHPHHPHFHHHSVTKRNSPNYLTSEPPPPLPPPRGTIAPPPPPLSASPTPSSNSSITQIPVQNMQNTTNSVNNSSSALHQQLQHIMKRMSPNSANSKALTNGVHVSSRAQAYSYASSASSSSPQRGTSPISFINGHSSASRTMTNCAPTLGPMVNNHLAQHFQNMGLQYSSNSHSNTANSSIAPQLLPYTQSPVSFNSIYSPPPSYAASSSSGRQSPTPTISSSSDYASVPPQGLNANMQSLHKKLSPVSSTSSVSSLTPTSCPTSSSASKASLVNRPSLQAWTARQAVSQSPVIMQSVKSTQVQKPVLQTAIAPTIPPISSIPQSRTDSIPPPVPPPSYPNSSPNTSNQQNVSSQLMTTPPPYLSSVQKTTNRTTTIGDCYPANPPPSYATAMQQQQQKQQFHQLSAETSVVPQSPPPPPLSQPPPPPPPPPYTAPKPQDTQYVSVVSPFNSDFNNSPVPVQVPTTEPPSYASSVAALVAQRAGISGTQQTNSSYNTRTAPAVQMPTRPPPMPPCADRSDLVNTVESICNSQVSALQGVPSSALNSRRQLEAVPPLPPKPNQLNSDVTSIASSGNTDFDSDSASVSTASTCDRSKKLQRKTTHQSPIPPRKSLSKEKEKERRESKVKIYSPAAFKFFMEQHVENVIKSHQQRERRRQQLESEMAKVGLSEEDQCQMRKMLHQKESNYLRLKRAKMDRSLFTKIKTIGVGAFGEVALVRKNDANQLYAMKTLRKSDVLKRNQVAHVKAERDILAEADNEWVVKLYYSFQDADHLYFVMDYIPGGDLMSLLIKFGIFEEPLAMFYIAELVRAVESVHKMGFIHRDIKPDNILIDSDGHIKLTDFGLCTGFRWTHNSKYYQRNNGIDSHDRQDSMDIDESWGANNCHCFVSSNKPLERRKRREHQRCLAHSLVGTPNYIAPEVLMRTGYTQLCDWWSVGVILYEMIVGQPPFFANTPEETQNKVIHWDKTLRIPKEANLSDNATDLIRKLCCGPEDRIGKNSADQIKKHPFFESIDFENGLRKQSAPYIPEIKYETDTSNFDPIDTDKLHSNGTSNGVMSREDYDYMNGQMNGHFPDNSRHPEHAFFEFTFRRFFDAGGQAYPIKLSDSDSANNTSDTGQGSPVYV